MSDAQFLHLILRPISVRAVLNNSHVSVSVAVLCVFVAVACFIFEPHEAQGIRHHEWGHTRRRP